MERELAELRSRSASSVGTTGIQAGNVIWIFCTGRSGSTWLSSMMGDLEEHEVWREPKIGQLFGDFYYVHTAEGQRKAAKFILGGGHEDAWLRSIRSMVMEGIASRFPGLGRDGHLVIKEPGGSTGAPLIMRAMPESRMVLLVRDPRDVISSLLDADKEGGWIQEWRDKSGKVKGVGRDPLVVAKGRATNYLRQMSHAKRAYDAHGGRKALVRYEDLVADALGTMRGMYRDLGVAVEEGELARAVEGHSWGSIPEEEKGEGKFYRKATPGGWREDLTPEQAEAVEKVTAPLLRELYP